MAMEPLPLLYLENDAYRQRLVRPNTYMEMPHPYFGVAPAEIGNTMQPGPPKERTVIWEGIMDWQDRAKPADDPRMRPIRTYNCQILSYLTLAGREPEIHAEMWPRRLVMQLIPKNLVNNLSNLGQLSIHNSRQVFFHLGGNPDDLNPLNEVMSSGYAGCIHLAPNPNNIRVIILLYSQVKRSYIGFVPNDQHGFVTSLRVAIEALKVRRAYVDNYKPERLIRAAQHLPVPLWGNSIQQQQQQQQPPPPPQQQQQLPPPLVQKVEGWLNRDYPYGGPSTSSMPGNNAGRFGFVTSSSPSPQHSGSPTNKRKRKESTGLLPAPKTLKITKHSATVIDEAFSCIVCQGPMRHPVFTNCCNSLVACKKCSIDWAAESNTCLKCRAVNPVYTEVLGLHEGIGALKDSGFFD